MSQVNFRFSLRHSLLISIKKNIGKAPTPRPKFHFPFVPVYRGAVSTQVSLSAAKQKLSVRGASLAGKGKQSTAITERSEEEIRDLCKTNTANGRIVTIDLENKTF